MSPPIHLTGIRIHWQKRTLDEFSYALIDVLATRFNLIVIDHPWAEFCFERNSSAI